MGYLTNVIVSVSLILVPVFSANPVEIIVNQSSPVQISVPVEASKRPVVKSSVPSATQMALINKYSEKYDVSAKTMLAVMSCENPEFDEDLQSRVIQKDGTREESYGLVQIHLPSNPNVTYEQATDPDFSIEFLASGLSRGLGSRWTCFRNLAKSG